jgi:hypothetical protein
MDKVYQIFVSSTFSDLRDERQQVSNTLAKAGYVAAGMELFPATDQQQFEYIKRVIDRSDYYVVILGGRYGTLSDDGVGFTEKEFEYAKAKGIPVLAFLHHDPKKLTVERTDQDAAKAELLENFRKTLQTGRLVEFWNGSDDLCTKVIIAVANAVNLTPGIGWVRGDQAIDLKVLQEAERLRLENSELQKRLSELESTDDSFDPLLLGPWDKITLNIRAHGHGSGSDLLTVDVMLGDLFLDLYNKILSEPRERTIGRDAGISAAKLAQQYDSNRGYEIDGGQIATLRDQFGALGLIRPVAGVDGEDTRFVAWSITDKGRRFAIKKKALRKAESE